LQAKRQGAKLIVIDPRKTDFAKQADIYAPIRPGTDCALALSLLHVIIEEELGTKNLSGPLDSDSEVKITNYTPESVSISSNLLNNGFLVLSDTYYPGWKAFVDGRETKIYRADYILRGVYLAKGKHQVKFIYDPLSFKVGKYISLFTLLSLFLAMGIVKFKTAKP